MSKKKSKKRIEMGEDAWEEYQKKRKIKKAKRYRLKNISSVINWRVRKKIELIEYKGGKCIKCGYDKVQYPSAFHFHHRNPEEKSFRIGGATLAFEKLKKEADKCDLLCANCHAETHDEEYVERREKVINKYDKLKKTEIEEIIEGKIELKKNKNKKLNKKCLFCKSDFECYRGNKIQKYCSAKCYRNFKKTSSKKPSKKELKDFTKMMSWCAIGRKYGVSDNAVRKWAKGYGII